MLITALMLITTFAINTDKLTESKKQEHILPILSIAFVVRVIFALCFKGYETDMNCFNAWAEMIYSGGISNFYSSGQFTDYPPGYMYVLYLIGFIKSIFSPGEKLTYLLLKLPAIICDIASGYVLYNISRKKNSASTSIASLYLFNPVVILNSSIWGQVDSVYILPVLMMLNFLMNKKLIASYFMFALAIIIKPQALFFAPILFSAVVEQVFMQGFSLKKFSKNLLFGLAAILTIFILILPFGIGDVISQYQKTIGSYNFASINAYNLWSAFGMNWSQLSAINALIGYLFIVVITTLCVWLFFKRKSEDKFFYLGALVCFSVFVLSVKMHERYAFPSVLLLLCAYAVSKKKQIMHIYGLVSSILFVNIAHVLFYYKPETYYSSGFHDFTIIFGILSVIILITWWSYTLKKDQSITYFPARQTFAITGSNFRMTKKDILIISIVTVIYSIIAIYNLGNIKAPQSYTLLNTDEEISIDLGKETNIREIKVYNGFYEISENRTFNIVLVNEAGEISEDITCSKGGVFFWNELKTNSAARYIRIRPNKEVSIMEMGIIDENGDLVIPHTAPSELFDEQAFVPAKMSYKNSTYFDEIYHARTAYEFINGLPVYEWTHPPLGKIFISAGIKLFGMSPFGWRISGTLFGIFMIPVLYVFIKMMFGFTWLATLGSVLLSSDFMHFTQSRIATIDVYVTFFILLMYLLMFKYYRDNLFINNRKKGHLILALCGLVFGLAIASKWTGFYSGAGIALIYFLALIDSYKKDNTDFWKRFTITCSLCVIFFIVIPAVIYVVSYIPYLNSNKEGLIGIIQNQEAMFTYHSKTVVDSTHPFSSYWYEWIFDLRPIWYYSSKESNMAESISCMGNPFIFWIGFPALIYCIYKAINTGDKKAILLTIAYLSNIIPWTFVERTTFIYHYFPCVPFIVMLLCYTGFSLMQYNKNTKKYFIIFTAAAVILFIVFYPAISGFSVKEGYLEFLKWLPGWQII